MVKSICIIAMLLILAGCNSATVNKHEGDIGVKVDGTCRLVDAQKATTDFASVVDPYTLPEDKYIDLASGDIFRCTVKGWDGSWIKIEGAWDNLVRISYCLKGSERGDMVVTYQNLQETLAKEPEKFLVDKGL